MQIYVYKQNLQCYTYSVLGRHKTDWKVIILTYVKDRIKELRNKLNLTQEEFGNKIGLSKSGISNIENGTRNVSSRHIKLICSVFDVNESWLTTGIDDTVKLETLSNSIVHFEEFRKYLLSLGYSIDIQKIDESDSGMKEEILDANGKVLGQAWTPDEESYAVILEKEKTKTVFTSEQFTELQNNIEKAIAFEVFKANSNIKKSPTDCNQ